MKHRSVLYWAISAFGVGVSLAACALQSDAPSSSHSASATSAAATRTEFSTSSHARASGAIFYGISPPLGTLPPASESPSRGRVVPNWTPAPHPLGGAAQSLLSGEHEPLAPATPLETLAGPMGPSSPITSGSVNVDGVNSNASSPVPPDPEGVVGPLHFVEIVNSQIGVFSKTGTLFAGYPKDTNSLWSTFGGPCQTNNDGDGIVRYDRFADRWLISQFALTFPPDPSPNTTECVAISTSGDPTGTYALYGFTYPNLFADYPKIGVWPDAYYATFNAFDFSNNFVGAQVCAYDRTNMLQGNPATQQCITNASNFNVLPADLDGTLQPPLGAPNPLVAIDPSCSTTCSNLELFQFHVDWQNTANTALTGPTALPVSSFTIPCTTSLRGACIVEPSPGNNLEALQQHPMNRFDYRRFPDTPGQPGHESLVFTQSVVAGSSVGLRVYELRNATGMLPPGGAATVFQDELWAPDGDFRWMGSAAMNKMGSIGFGYSDSSSTSNPGIRVAGQLAGGTPGPETTLFTGAGVQTGLVDLLGDGVLRPNSRWGDYTDVTVDPGDDCTFWYVNQYQPANGQFNWHTRIANFTVGSCVAFPCTARATAATANGGQLFSNGGSLIDSYQSSLGNYGGSNVSSHGNVVAGTGIVHNGGVIHGAQTPKSSGAPLQPIPPPAGAKNLGNVTVNGGQTTTLAAGDYVAATFTLNGTLNISGGVVRIWVTGSLGLGGTANLNGIPQNLQFFYGGTNDVNVNGGGRGIFALIYAPDARINLGEAVFGSVTGSTISLNGGSAIHFDLSSAGATSTPTVPAACPTLPPQSCLSTSAQTVLLNGGDVAAYVPNGDWSTPTTGVKVVSVEGTAFTGFSIATGSPVNSCATNNLPTVAGEVVCTANDTNVYHITGAFPPSTVATLTSGSSGTVQLSGGSCQNCGVAIDAVNRKAVVAMGLGPSTAGGVQFLDLATNTFATPPILTANGNFSISEDIAIDTTRSLVLSPIEVNDYQLLNNNSSSSVFNFNPSGVTGQFDSAAEDCTTGVALSSREFAGGIFMVDLGQVTTGVGSNWTVLPNAQNLKNIPEFNFVNAGTSGIAVDSSGTHLGVVADEFGGSGFGGMHLPSNPNPGTPLDLVDWASANVPNDPNNVAWAMGRDPHTTTVYRSPSTGHATAILMNSTRTFLALVDLNQLLDTTVVARSGTDPHAVSSTVNLQTVGSPAVLRFIALPP